MRARCNLHARLTVNGRFIIWDIVQGVVAICSTLAIDLASLLQSACTEITVTSWNCSGSAAETAAAACLAATCRSHSSFRVRKCAHGIEDMHGTGTLGLGFGKSKMQKSNLHITCIMISRTRGAASSACKASF